VLGINGGEFLLLIVVALVVVGPERLPRYAEQLGAWVRTARSYALSAKSRVTEELGEDIADVDWAALDPRRYDPRRIVREALLDDSPPSRSPRPRPTSSGAAAAAGAAGTAAEVTGASGAGAAAGASAAGPAQAPAGDGGARTNGDGAAAGGSSTAVDPVAGTPFDDEAT
jgi:sec-independent protein translocase protein TatB